MAKRKVSSITQQRRERARLRRIYENATREQLPDPNSPEARRERLLRYLKGPEGQAALREVQKGLAAVSVGFTGLQAGVGAMQARMAGRNDLAVQFEVEESKARDLFNKLKIS